MSVDNPHEITTPLVSQPYLPCIHETQFPRMLALSLSLLAARKSFPNCYESRQTSARGGGLNYRRILTCVRMTLLGAGDVRKRSVGLLWMFERRDGEGPM